MWPAMRRTPSQTSLPAPGFVPNQLSWHSLELDTCPRSSPACHDVAMAEPRAAPGCALPWPCLPPGNAFPSSSSLPHSPIKRAGALGCARRRLQPHHCRPLPFLHGAPPSNALRPQSTTPLAPPRNREAPKPTHELSLSTESPVNRRRTSIAPPLASLTMELPTPAIHASS